MPESHAELISREAEAMALKITGLMESARRATDLDELHALVQHLVIIRQTALAIREEAEDEGPRRWALPVIDANVALVKDDSGNVWRRGSSQDIWHSDNYPFNETEQHLIAEYGPLTEVTDA